MVTGKCPYGERPGRLGDNVLHPVRRPVEPVKPPPFAAGLLPSRVEQAPDRVGRSGGPGLLGTGRSPLSPMSESKHGVSVDDPGVTPMGGISLNDDTPLAHPYHSSVPPLHIPSSVPTLHYTAGRTAVPIRIQRAIRVSRYDMTRCHHQATRRGPGGPNPHFASKAIRRICAKRSAHIW